jgi:RNA polymerase sigma-70 factor (ECF subfamily)
MQKITGQALAGFAAGTAAASPNQRSDQHLIERIAGGDRSAMETLYKRHSAPVYRFVLRFVNNAAAAEDLTADVFLEIWKQAHRFEARSQVSTWMLAIARHRALSSLRGRRTEPLDDAMLTAIPDSAGDAETMLQEQDNVSALRQALTRLSPAHREIVDLVYYHDKSIAEVAEITGAPANTVKTRMFYARKALARLLDGRGLESAA